MELLTARPELKELSGITGAELDAQHKKLFDMADALQNAMHQGGGGGTPSCTSISLT